MQVRESVLRRGTAALLTGISVFTFASDLSRPLATWDEAIYFNVAQNVVDGYWLLPKFTLESHPLPVFEPFLQKPPLAYWIQAGAMTLGGETPAIARVPSLIAMSGVVGLTVLLAWRLSGPVAGVLAGLLTLFVPALRATHGANSVSTDPFLLLFGFAGVYCLVLFVETERDRWAWVAGTGYGAAILTKWVAAAPFGLFVLPYLYRHRARVGWDGFGRVAAGGVAVVAPWFLVTALVAFDELLRQMVTTQVVARATGQRYAEQAATFAFMRYPYFRTAPAYFGVPFYGLSLAAAITIGRHRLSGSLSDLDVLMWPLAAGVVGLYAVAGGNHIWYIMPAGVPIAVLVADAVTTVADYWTTARPSKSRDPGQ